MTDRPNTQLDADMARLADGDRAAFTPVFRALRPLLVAFCERALGAGADPDDATQLALEKIFERASEYDPSRPALAWALAIASWECATIRRRRQRSGTESGVDQDKVPSSARTPEEETLAKELDRTLRETILELSRADREALDAAFLKDTVEGPTTPAFRKQKERALSRLRNLWRRREA